MFATSLIQIAASFAIAGPLAISVVIVQDQFLPESWIGYYTSLLYAAAIVGSVATTRLLSKFSIRVVQLGALVATGLGYVLFSGIQTELFRLVLACVGIAMMGLAYGVIVPSSSLALSARYAPRLQPLVVSVRQTGVPVGTALVALIAPLVAHRYGWHYMTGVVLVVIAGVYLAALPGLRASHVGSTNPPPRQHIGAALRNSLAQPATRRLALISGAYGINQAALTTYLVPSLVNLHDLSVARAAGYLATATIAGALARIAFGFTIARFGRVSLHLGLIGVISGLAWLLLLWPDPGRIQLAIGSAVLGMTAMGWNGILLAEIGLVAPTGRATEAVATGTSFAYFGVLVAPLLYVQLDGAFGSRTGAVAGLAALAIIGGAALLAGIVTQRDTAAVT